MASASETRYVILRGGLSVPLQPLLLLLNLEARGFDVARDGDDLVIRPPGQLTDDDRAQLRRWKRQLLALVAYEPPAGVM